jgi:heterodisulfide reductase subunit A
MQRYDGVAEEETIMSERVGVYICHCGTNIAGMVDVAEVTRWAGELPNVAIARDYKFMCSSLGQDLRRTSRSWV